MQNNKSSFAPLWIFIIVCFISITASLFIALSLSASLEDTNFTIDGIAVAKYKSTNDVISILPLKNSAIKEQGDEFIKRFLTEYIVNRYTVSGNNLVMETNLGYKTPNSIEGNKGILLKLPSRMIRNGMEVWTGAYTDFIKNDLPEITKLMNENTTRSVRIISEPKQIGDWWVTTVEFIYRNPTTYSFSIAKKEKYEIRLNISKPNLKPINQVNLSFPAGNVFAIGIFEIQKIKL